MNIQSPSHIPHSIKGAGAFIYLLIVNDKKRPRNKILPIFIIFKYRLYIKMDDASHFLPQYRNEDEISCISMLTFCEFGPKVRTVAIGGWICGVDVPSIHTLDQSQVRLSCQIANKTKPTG